MPLVPVSDDTLEEEVLGAPGVVALLFGAVWDAPSVLAHRVLSDLAWRVSARLCYLDVGGDQSVAALYRVRELPTVLFFRDGGIVGKLVGRKNAAHYLLALDTAAVAPWGAGGLMSETG